VLLFVAKVCLTINVLVGVPLNVIGMRDMIASMAQVCFFNCVCMCMCVCVCVCVCVYVVVAVVVVVVVVVVIVVVVVVVVGAW